MELYQLHQHQSALLPILYCNAPTALDKTHYVPLATTLVASVWMELHQHQIALLPMLYCNAPTVPDKT
jgi:hypothetical protein